MSMHGRIYVEKDRGLDKQRMRYLRRHYEEINSINLGKRKAYDMKDMMRSQDTKIKNMKAYKDIDKFNRNVINRSPGSVPYENRRIMLKLNGIMTKVPSGDIDCVLSKSPSRISL